MFVLRRLGWQVFKLQKKNQKKNLQTQKKKCNGRVFVVRRLHWQVFKFKNTRTRTKEYVYTRIEICIDRYYTSEMVYPHIPTNTMSTRLT